MLLLLLGAELVDRAHRERALDGDEGAQARVPGLQLHASEAVLDGAPARAAVALQVHAQEAEAGELGDDLPREDRPVKPVLYVRFDLLPHKRADAIAHREFLLREVGLDVEEVVPRRGRRPPPAPPALRASRSPP